ncbi:MAG: hypothetical protein ACK4EY_16170 [Flavipsychrobacter sp.]
MDRLSYKITVESATQVTSLPSFAALRVSKSIHSIIETGVIELPINAMVRTNGKLNTASVDTAKQFNEGDKVEILAGYNGVLKHEFKGFVRRKDFTDPCKLILEGYSYQLRKKAPQKSWKKANLRDVLKELIAGTDITIHPDTATDLYYEPLYIGLKQQTALEVIEDLKVKKAIVAYFINGNELYMGGDALALRNEVVRHKLGWNTTDESQLIYRRAEDVKVAVKVSYTDSKGKKREVTGGEKGGIERPYLFGRLSSSDEAIAIAIRDAQQYRYEGYEGRIKTRLVPYCQPGYKSEVTDEIYNVRAQNVIVEATELEINDDGDTRTIELGKRINKQV